MITALDEEGFADTLSSHLIESFARNFMVAVDAWHESGFGAVAKTYLERLPREKGVRRDIDDNGDLLIRRMASGQNRAPASCCPAQAAVLVRRQEQGTARMKLLRTIRLDPSDTFVFDPVAEPGEWAVSGAFAFWGGDPAALEGKARTAFRSGFLGVGSLGWSTLVQIVEASEQTAPIWSQRLPRNWSIASARPICKWRPPPPKRRSPSSSCCARSRRTR